MPDVSAPPARDDARPKIASAVSGAKETKAIARRKTPEDFGWPEVGLFVGDANGKPLHTLAEFRAKLETEVDFRDAVFARAKARLPLFYGHLFKSLVLSEAEFDQLSDLLVDKEFVHIDTLESERALGIPDRQTRKSIRTAVLKPQEQIDGQIESLLGASRYAQYERYRQDLVPWTIANALAAKLISTPAPLSDEQATQLVDLLRGRLLQAGPARTFDIAYGAGLFSPRVASRLAPETVEEAARFLTDSQVEALRSLGRSRPPQSTAGRDLH